MRSPSPPSHHHSHHEPEQGDLLRIYTTAKRGGADFNLSCPPSRRISRWRRRSLSIGPTCRSFSRPEWEHARNGYKWLNTAARARTLDRPQLDSEADIMLPNLSGTTIVFDLEGRLSTQAPD
jgi:hypothetical protein